MHGRDELPRHHRSDHGSGVEWRIFQRFDHGRPAGGITGCGTVNPPERLRQRLHRRQFEAGRLAVPVEGEAQREGPTIDMPTTIADQGAISGFGPAPMPIEKAGFERFRTAIMVEIAGAAPAEVRRREPRLDMAAGARGRQTCCPWGLSR